MPPDSPIASSLAHGRAASLLVLMPQRSGTLHTHTIHMWFFSVFTLCNVFIPISRLLQCWRISPFFVFALWLQFWVSAHTMNRWLLCAFLFPARVSFSNVPKWPLSIFYWITVCDKRISYWEVKIVTCYVSERRLFAFIILPWPVPCKWDSDSP